MLFRPELKVVEPLMSAPALVSAIGRHGDHQADHTSGAHLCRTPIAHESTQAPDSVLQSSPVAQNTNLLSGPPAPEEAGIGSPIPEPVPPAR